MENGFLGGWQWNDVHGSYNYILKYCSPHVFLVQREEIIKEERDDTGNKPKKLYRTSMLRWSLLQNINDRNNLTQLHLSLKKKRHLARYSSPWYLQIEKPNANLHTDLLTFIFTHIYRHFPCIVNESWNNWLTVGVVYGSSTEGPFMFLSQNVPLAWICEHRPHGTVLRTCKQGLPLLLQEVHSEMPNCFLSTCGHPMVSIYYLNSK